MSYTEVKVVKLLKDNGFVGPDNALCPVEVESTSNPLYAQRSWFGFGKWVLAHYDSTASIAKVVKTLVVPWGNSLDTLEEGKKWEELKSLDHAAKWHSPVGLRNNKYTGLPEEVVGLALVTIHTVIDGEKEHILYALRANVPVPVSKGINDLVSALKLFGVKIKSSQDKDKGREVKKEDKRHEDRKYDRDYWRGRRR
jgi:hypothetical protein